MADWRDGAEYAPVERPDGFAMPVAEPLPEVEPERAATPGAMQAPTDYTATPAIPLQNIAAVNVPPRNPSVPFDVVGSVMTGDSAWGAARSSPYAPTTFDPSRPIQTSGTSVATDFPPPTQASPGLPPSGPWAPPIAPKRAQPTQGQPASPAIGQILYVAAGLVMLGFLFPNLVVGTMFVAGSLSLYALRENRQIGGWLLATGGGLLVLRLLLEDGSPSTTAAFLSVSALVSLAWAASLLVTAFRYGKRNR